MTGVSDRIIWLGSLAVALAASGSMAYASWNFLVPLALGATPPLAAKIEIAQLQGQVQVLQKNNADLQSHQAASDRNLDYTTMSILNLQLASAQKDAESRPSGAAAAYVRQLEDQINQIRARLGLPPLR